jgi:hypothetical protein
LISIAAVEHLVTRTDADTNWVMSSANELHKTIVAHLNSRSLWGSIGALKIPEGF